MSSKQDKLYTSNRLLSGIREIEKWHPHKMLTYLFLLGSFLVMIFLLITFTIEVIRQSEFLEIIKLPKFFIVASIVILLSGYFNRDILKLYHHDNIEMIRKKLFEKFLFGTVFLLFQFIGWLELVFQGLTLNSNVIGTYIFLLTSYHMVHMLACLVAIAWFLYKTKDIHIDPVSRLIYFTAPYERVKLEIFIILWRFIIFSWIFLFVWLVFIL